MSARSPMRFRLVAILAPTIALALGSFWLLEVMRRTAGGFLPSPQRSEPDFYVEKFNYVKMSKTGSAQYHISGTRLTHNPEDDSYDITLPVINNLGNVQAPMTIRSERAQVNSDNSQVRLYDNVHMDRPASPTNEPMHAKTEYLLVLPDDDVMRTDKPVELTLGRSKLTGTGMMANNATRELRLTSNVHGTYQASAR
jgi:lipopolysaccharide export system protein LptC